MNLKKHFNAIAFLTFMFLMAAPLFFSMGDSNAYTLKVNRNTNVVTAYNNSGAPVKAMTCSVGTGTKTPVGTFSILTKDSWHTLMGPVYAPYCSKVTSDGIWFHPVWYYQNGNRASQSAQSYNLLGTKASHGCIRLTLIDAKWIYENCPVGTKVIIFDGSAANDPLGKPATYKLPAMPNDFTWDPTDPDPSNPYHSMQPKIIVNNTTVQYKTKFNPADMVTVIDSLGNNVTSDVKYSGKVNTKKLGTYTVTYSITDQRGRSCSVKSKVTVIDIYLPVLNGISDSKTVEYKTKLNLKEGVSATGYKKRSLNKKIQITVKTPSKKTKKVKSTYTFKDLGKYTVTYKVTDPKYKRTTTQTMKIVVQDTKPPVMRNTRPYTVYIQLGSTKKVTKYIKANLVSGKSLRKKMTVAVRTPGSKKYVAVSNTNYKFTKTGLYKFKMTATNPKSNKSSSIYKYYRVKNDTYAPTISGVVNTTTKVNYRSSITAASLLKGVSATNKTKANLTGKIKLSYKAPGVSTQTALSKTAALTFGSVGNYTVYYTVTNPNSNKTKTVSRVFQVVDSSVKITSPVVTSTVSLDSSLTWDIYTDVTIHSDSTSAENLKSSVIKVTAVCADKDAPAASIDSAGILSFDTVPAEEKAFTYTISYIVTNANYNAVTFNRTITFNFPKPVTPSASDEVVTSDAIVLNSISKDTIHSETELPSTVSDEALKDDTIAKESTMDIVNPEVTDSVE